MSHESDVMRTARYWDREARCFDDAPDHGLHDPTVKEAWRRLLTACLGRPPARIADMGCGTGSLAWLLADAGHRVVGVDVSSEMVRAAQAKVRAAGVAVPFAVGDAATPPWCDGAFDVVLARHVVWALPSPEDVIRRWLALLAPGGRLMLIEGRWYTGAGIAAHDLSDVVRAAGAMTRLTTLGDARLWGGPTADVRYLMVCTRPGR